MPQDPMSAVSEIGYVPSHSDLNLLGPALGESTAPHDINTLGMSSDTFSNIVAGQPTHFGPMPQQAAYAQTDAGVEPQQAASGQSSNPLFDVPQQQSPGENDGGTAVSPPGRWITADGGWPTTMADGVRPTFIMSGSEAQPQADIPAGVDTLGMGKTITPIPGGSGDISVIQDSSGTKLVSMNALSSTETPLGPNQAIYGQPITEPGAPIAYVVTRNDAGQDVSYQSVGKSDTMATPWPDALLTSYGKGAVDTVAHVGIHLAADQAKEQTTDLMRDTGDTSQSASTANTTTTAGDGGTPFALEGGTPTAFGQPGTQQICPINDPTVTGTPWLAGSSQEMLNSLFVTSSGQFDMTSGQNQTTEGGSGVWFDSTAGGGDGVGGDG
jgi:hypothetical protein